MPRKFVDPWRKPLWLALVVLISGCAMKAAPTLPSAPKYPEFVYPAAVPAAARQAMNAGRLDEARAAYQRAIAATPDSAVLYRELGMVERRQGDAAAALEQFNRAVALDPSDAVSFAQAGEILEERGDFAGAETAYRNAANVDRFAGYDRKAEAVATRARDASLPAEFRALASADRITRGDLAALIGIRLED